MNDEQAAAAQEFIAWSLAEASSVDFNRLDPRGQDYWRTLARAAVAAMAAVSRDMEDERRSHLRPYPTRVRDYNRRIFDYTYAQPIGSWETTAVTNNTNSLRFTNFQNGAIVDWSSFPQFTQPDNHDPDEE